MWALIEPRLTTEPRPAARIIGTTAWVAKKWWRTLTRHQVVPLLHGQRLDVPALVVGRVVDQHRHRSQPLAGGGDRLLQRRDVAHVAVQVERLGDVAPGQRLGQRAPGVVLDVAEPDAHALGRELGDELGAEAGRAAADERHLAAQARVGGELARHRAGTITARPTAPWLSAA